MEFFPAGSLQDSAASSASRSTSSTKNARTSLKQAATGLAFMNAKGWVHRDVKPDNILVNSAGELRLIDFALAERIQKPSLFGKLFRGKQRTRGRAATCRRSRSAASPGRPGRHLQLRRHLLRAGDRPAAVPRRQRPGPAQQAHHREAVIAAAPQPGRHRRVRRPGAAHAGQEARGPAPRLPRGPHGPAHHEGLQPDASVKTA